MLFLFIGGTTFFTFLRAYSLSLMSLRMSKKLHEGLISKVLNAPINLYFDVTPIGRILNKFSKDLLSLDS